MTGERLSEAEELFVRWLVEHPDASEGDLAELCRAHPQHASALLAIHSQLSSVRRLLERAGLGLGREHGGSFAERLEQAYGSGIDPEIALEKEREVHEPPTSALLKRLSRQGLRRSRYALKGELARGGMGAILKVWDEDLRRSLAMKVILGKLEPSPGAGASSTPPVDRRLLARFLEEAQVTGQLDHPGIVPVHELGLDAEGRVYFTMKLVKGRDLRAIFELVFEEQEGWNETRALGVLLKVCEAMAYSHAKGVIHRDLKPANVMVGSFGEVYVMDWGLARVLGRADQHDLRVREAETPLTSVKTERREEREEAPDSPLFTMDGDVVGTPAYMPPEQALGAVERLSPRSDVYAIGAMLYHLLARHMPYVPAGGRMTNRMVLLAVTQGPPAPLSTLRRDAPAELVAIVERAMAREPELRYRDTLELADDLRAYLEHRVVAAYETGAWAETKKWVQRNRTLAASLASAVFLLALGLTASLVFRARAEERAAALLVANTTIRMREAEARRADAEATERALEARANLYVAAVAGAQSAYRSNEPESVRRFLDSAPEELRNWEWRYLDAASDPSLFTLQGDYSPSFSPDGARIVATSPDNTARVWDTRTGTESTRLEGHADAVRSATFSPNGSRIVTASADKTVRVWDANGKELTRLEGHTNEVSSAHFSPDGSRILTTSADEVRVWDATIGKELTRFNEHANVTSACFGPEGSRILTASASDTCVWDASSGIELVRLEGNTNRVTSASFSPDGSRFLTASGNDMCMWDTASGEALGRMKGHTSGVTAAYFSPDGSRILTTSRDKTALVWDSNNGRGLARLTGHTSGIAFGAFSLDGSRIVTASQDNTARVWDSANGKEILRLEGHSNDVTSSTFSPDGSCIVTASLDDIAYVWDASTGKGLARLGEHTILGTSATFTPDGSRIVTALDDTAYVWDATSERELTRLEGHSKHVLPAYLSPDGSRIVTASWDNTARVWDATTGKETGRLEGHSKSVNSACFSPDGSRIVTASEDSTARVWNAISGKETARLEGHSKSVSSACFSPDGLRIGTASWDKTTRMWDAVSGKELACLKGHTGWVSSACFSPDGLRIVTASLDNTARLWDAVSGKELACLKGHTARVNSALLSPDGSRIVTASADQTARVWDAADGKELACLNGHTAWLSSAYFSPDGSRIVTGSDDQTARIWDVASGQELARLEGHLSGVASASFSPDGSRIVTASTDGTARVWDSAPYLVRRAERQALLTARSRGQQLADEALIRSSGLVEAGTRLRSDDSLDSLVRRAALDVLSEHASSARRSAQEVQAKHLERTWLAHLVGIEQWPSEREVGAALSAEAGLPTDPRGLNTLAWPLVDPDSPPSGSEVRALVLARRAVASAGPENVAAYRDTLARALYRLGRFDEALEEQRRAIVEASPAMRPDYENYLHRLESDIASWRDDSRELRRAEIEQRIQSLDHEISVLEQDPDVRRWLVEE